MPERTIERVDQQTGEVIAYLYPADLAAVLAQALQSMTMDDPLALKMLADTLAGTDTIFANGSVYRLRS